MDHKQSFESWAVIELFGHQKLAGLITEAAIGGSAFLRVDIPATGDQPAYTRFFGNGAIYSMTPCTEEIARDVLAWIRPKPIEPYMLSTPTNKTPASVYQLPENNIEDGVDDLDEELF